MQKTLKLLRFSLNKNIIAALYLHKNSQNGNEEADISG